MQLAFLTATSSDMKKQLHANEIRDYVERAPKRLHFDGNRMVNNTDARLTWLASLTRGTINERINRRAGITEIWIPWKYPVGSAVRRNYRNNLRKLGTPSLANLFH